MPFFPKSYDDLVAQGLRSLRLESNITQISPGSKARFLLDSISREQVNQHELFDNNLLQPFVRFADGKFLDFFGDMMQVPRWESTNATVDASHFNFMFYVDSGTFGDINKGANFTIPGGTRISTLEFNVQRSTSNQSTTGTREKQTKISYTVLSDVVCLSDSSHVWAAIRAVVEGKKSDVPRNALRKHEFTGYALSNQGLLKCTNKYGIANGRDRESDESYRYRLMNAFKAKERANKIAIRLAALSVPGVSDVIEINVEQGPGTYSLYIESIAGTVSPGLLSAVTSAVESVSSFGVRPFILGPIPLGLEFVIGLRWKDTATETDKVLAQTQIRGKVEDYLAGIGIGDELDLDGMVPMIVSSSPYISGMGLLNPGKFEEVYIHRSSPDGNGTRKSLFSGNTIEPLYNERVMLETSTRFRGIQFL